MCMHAFYIKNVHTYIQTYRQTNRRIRTHSARTQTHAYRQSNLFIDVYIWLHCLHLYNVSTEQCGTRHTGIISFPNRKWIQRTMVSCVAYIQLYDKFRRQILYNFNHPHSFGWFDARHSNMYLLLYTPHTFTTHTNTSTHIDECRECIQALTRLRWGGKKKYTKWRIFVFSYQNNSRQYNLLFSTKYTKNWFGRALISFDCFYFVAILCDFFNRLKLNWN